MDGFAFVSRLRALPGCGRTPVVVISCLTGEPYWVRGREVGVAHYLFKPADLGVVERLLSELVTEHDRPRRDLTRCLRVQM